MQEIVKTCPVCSGTNFELFLKGKDFFLTGEEFVVHRCINCGLKFTNPRPCEENIQKYYESENYISHDSKKQDLISTVYKLARRLAIKRKYSIIKAFSKGERILEIGCGTGELLNYCQKRGMEVYGVEPNYKAREFARVKYALQVFEKLNEAHGKFNCICLWHVLEHLPSLSGTFKDIENLLYPGGSVIIAIPNAESWDAQHYKNHWAAYDLPRHLYHFSESSFCRLANNHGFEIVKAKPQKLDAFYISLLSEKYKTGKNNYCSALTNGLKSNIYAVFRKIGHSSTIFILRRKKT